MLEFKTVIGLGIVAIVANIVIWGGIIFGGIYFALWALKHFGVI